MLQLFNNLSNVRANEPMSQHTSFKVGGGAEVFIEAQTENELLEAITICRKNDLPFFILGNGSNILVKDEGIRGVVVSLMCLNEIRLVDDSRIYAQAGVLMKNLADFAKSCELGTMEFVHGIPGSVGGGIFMNAGAYDGEMKDIFISARCIDKSNTFVNIDSDAMSFSYRKSAAQIDGLIVVSAILQGKKLDAVEIAAKMQELKEKRSSKQPLEMASAGSTFKRPPGKFAGKLIMDAGLRGYRIGGAQVSEKHCGFLINTGNATASDVLELIKHIQNTVYEKFGVKLEPEVKIIGESKKVFCE